MLRCERVRRRSQTAMDHAGALSPAAGTATIIAIPLAIEAGAFVVGRRRNGLWLSAEAAI